ncbi:E3 ubiquitin-protein ligase NEDD4-like [Mizuhopecten yessoensis]|uniref:HECT-type E3 ubiquitin transferase n=1 Tax=Mizuhopecten yessoensis TaxID=6573 RepID=A0A210Q452_MIZYE|nr:E3 ubiquitin-protein ligase NEDD4-like [Mizuhopecten yessoensis]OWF43459.1 E3 ubiquitin-protein ligase RSP5 [Mizuhopecten yessoensis]
MACAQRPSSYGEILAELSSYLTKCQVTVRRENVFKDLVEILLRPEAEKSRFEVKFTNDGWTEPATDGGGPRNQLFTLFYQECLTPERCMFSGRGQELFPVDNPAALTGRWFFCLGRAIVLSLVQQGAGFPYLARSCYKKILYKEGVPEHENMAKLLQKLTKAQTQARTEEELLHYLGDSEIKLLLKEMQVTECETTKTETMYHLKNFITLQSCTKALAQLTEGLQSLGFLDKVKQYGSDLERFFVHTEGFYVDSVFMQNQLLDPLMDLQTTSEKQNEVKEWAALCLTSMTDEQAVNLYEFITGMRSLPPGECVIMIAFNAQKTSDKLPRAVTCASLLLLPLGNESVKEFIRSFKTALENRSEFGRI